MIDKEKLTKMRSTIGEIVYKMETYIVNNDDVEPIELMQMYIELRDVKDIIMEEIFKS